MNVESPFFKATNPAGRQYTIELENVISLQLREIYISLGKLCDHHVVLSEPQKTRLKHHCSLQCRKNPWWIVDNSSADSANGTCLQREIARPEIDVQSEDVLFTSKCDRIYLVLIALLCITAYPCPPKLP